MQWVGNLWVGLYQHTCQYLCPTPQSVSFMSMATSCGFCKHDPDIFSVCGVFISAKSIKYKIFEWNLFCLAYNVYFSAQVGDKDKTWALHVVRRSCRSILEAWYRGENWRMKFGVPRIWHKSTDHLQNCYFCKVVVTSHRQERKRIFSTIPTSLHLFDQLSLSSQMKSFPNCPASILPDCSSNENNVWWCRAWWYLCCTS